MVLADAHRKDTLRRMRAAIFHDANRNEFGVRLPDGRILYRPTHSEAIALWYGEDARQRPGMTTVPGQTPGEEKAQQPRRKMRRPVEAVDPESGEVRHRFNCAADAERAGFRLDCIHAAPRGKVKTHAGWLWRYAGDPVPPQPLPQPPAQIHPLPQLQSEGAPSNDPVRASERTGRRHGARSVERSIQKQAKSATVSIGSPMPREQASHASASMPCFVDGEEHMLGCSGDTAAPIGWAYSRHRNKGRQKNDRRMSNSSSVSPSRICRPQCRWPNFGTASRSNFQTGLAITLTHTC